MNRLLVVLPETSVTVLLTSARSPEYKRGQIVFFMSDANLCKEGNECSGKKMRVRRLQVRIPALAADFFSQNLCYRVLGQQSACYGLST